jgi:hypothetical protein
MVAVTEPGWDGGGVFFRGACPDGAQPATTTAPCVTAAVYFFDGSTTPATATASVSAVFHS